MKKSKMADPVIVLEEDLVDLFDEVCIFTHPLTTLELREEGELAGEFT